MARSGVAIIILGIFAGVWDMIFAGRLRAVGEWWFMLHSASLQTAQPAIERHIAPWLWDPLILSVLEMRAGVLLLGLGAALVFASVAARRLRTA